MAPEDLRILFARRDRVLNRMMVLSDAPAGTALQGKDRKPVRVTAPTPGSKLPPGVRLDLLDGMMGVSPTVPDKGRSLFDFYFWHFQRARTTDEMNTLVFLGERDLDERTRTGESTADRHRARNRSILSSRYLDQAPEVVAACERCSNAHVRKQRQLNGLDAMTGRPVDRVHRTSKRVHETA